jgi:hypothetical protein
MPTISARDQVKKLSIVLVLLFVILQLIFSRFHLLDDAFIHLRIAHNLLDSGYFAYNVQEPSFATSSPLYTLVLALFSIVSRTPLLPKVVNVLIYFVILYLIGRELVRSEDSIRTTILFALLLLAASPMSIRWLTDGMETGLVALFAIALALATHKTIIEKEEPSISSTLLISVLAALAILLRVEFGYILAVAITVISIHGVIAGSPDPLALKLKHTCKKTSPFVLGGIAGFALILIIFGRLLPDPAVAKQEYSGSMKLFDVFDSVLWILKAHVGASFFGMGLLIVWAVSASLAYRTNQNAIKYCVLAANSSMLLFILLLLLSHQDVQGVRYYIFIEAFLVALNYLFLSNTRQDVRPKPIAYLVFVIMLLWITFDAVSFYKISAGRSETYKRFTETDYSYLQNKRGIAYDIGMIGFFTKGYILDMSGLVNGRQKAELSSERRLEAAASDMVDFIFANSDQLRDINAYIDTSTWNTLGEFDFPNASGNPDTHFLIVRSGVFLSDHDQHEP